ncbi:MAG: GNAT family N-acetyltransferase [Xanthomonadales bacterium]|nr:GNAT family N-acetyltransferase [Xanthomonadales bacterium]
MTGDVSIEHARDGDLPAILGILNHYIQNDHCTFDTEPWSVAQKQAWFDAHDSAGPYQLLVAREGSEVLAYVHSDRWRPKKAYNVTVETTVYVAPFAHGRGLGQRLMETLFESIHGNGLHSAVAGVTQPNAASDALHLKLGFEKVGTFREVGYKFGQFHDVTWYRKALGH